MKAIVNTKSNYGNLNGKELDVIEIAGKRVSCQVFSTEFNKNVTIDFGLSEVKEFIGTAVFGIQGMNVIDKPIKYNEQK